MAKPKTQNVEDSYYDVRVYQAQMVRGTGKRTVHHTWIEVIGECLNEPEVANFVMQTVYEALKKTRKVNVRLEKGVI